MALERRLPGEDGAKEAEELGLNEGIDPPALRRQIEFYFSDSNLPRDSCALSSNTSASLLSDSAPFLSLLANGQLRMMCITLSFLLKNTVMFFAFKGIAGFRCMHRLPLCCGEVSHSYHVYWILRSQGCSSTKKFRESSLSWIASFDRLKQPLLFLVCGTALQPL